MCFCTVVARSIPSPIGSVRMCVYVCVCVCVCPHAPTCTANQTYIDHSVKSSVQAFYLCPLCLLQPLFFAAPYLAVLCWRCPLFDSEQPVGSSMQGSAGQINTMLCSYCLWARTSVCVSGALGSSAASNSLQCSSELERTEPVWPFRVHASI